MALARWWWKMGDSGRLRSNLGLCFAVWNRPDFQTFLVASVGASETRLLRTIPFLGSGVCQDCCRPSFLFICSRCLTPAVWGKAGMNQEPRKRRKGRRGQPRGALRQSGTDRSIGPSWRSLSAVLRRASSSASSWFIAVGMPLSGHPPHRSQRADFPHWAPASDVDA